MTGPCLISLAGVSGAGKDTAGAYLAERHGYVRVAVADPMKELMMRLFGLSREQLWGDERNVPCARLGRPPRELYQQFGRACREIDADVWVKAFRHTVHERLARSERVVCTDVRMLAEARVVRELGGSVWHLRRAGAGAPGALSLDATETEVVAGFDGFDAVIDNDGSVADLHTRLDEVLAASSAAMSAR
ncbi:MAG TPA: hypothetical protein VFJ82_13525 [Longimicrobium sp.]|nr:hypothetical protein [Longimicrobium sp.]